MTTAAELAPTSTVQPIALTTIRMDESSQSRVRVQRSVVRAYAEAMKQQREEGQLRFPAIVLFWDGQDYWLADGFHRVLAARESGLAEFPAEIQKGTGRDALLFAISANSAHGLPRSNADKKKAVALLLTDPEWSQWSDREIARRCQVTHRMVGKFRRGASGDGIQMRQRKARRGGKVYEIATDRSPASESAADIETEVPRQADISPTTDLLGISLAEPMKPVFACLADFQSLRTLYAQLAGLIDRIARSPGGEVMRQHLQIKTGNGTEDFASTELDVAFQKLTVAEPYCSFCPRCHALRLNCFITDCHTCRGRGWTTRAAFEACSENSRRDMLKALAAPATLGAS
ncbi:MAG TPA: ParB/RepB/Spo0J family partition protein [Gemmataceae bacterium]|jgi:hypothetical protein|nr:ParB/RepB/Spo0J family partition protein [Gemmataceae bacterium]